MKEHQAHCCLQWGLLKWNLIHVIWSDLILEMMCDKKADRWAICWKSLLKYPFPDHTESVKSSQPYIWVSALERVSVRELVLFDNFITCSVRSKLIILHSASYLHSDRYVSPPDNLATLWRDEVSKFAKIVAILRKQFCFSSQCSHNSFTSPSSLFGFISGLNAECQGFWAFYL